MISDSAGPTTYETGTLAGSPTWDTGFPDNVPPAAPTVLDATGIVGGVSLTWTAPTDTDLAGYHVYRSETSPVDTTTPLASLVPGVTYTDNSGSTGTTYYYVVKAVDTSGNKSAASNEDSAAPLAGTPPNAPSGLTATATSATVVTLNWTDNSSNETGFEIHRSTTGSGGTYTLKTTTVADVNTYPDSGLTPLTEYCYKMRAINGAGPSAFTSSDMCDHAGRTFFCIAV